MAVGKLNEVYFQLIDVVEKTKGNKERVWRKGRYGGGDARGDRRKKDKLN